MTTTSRCGGEAGAREAGKLRLEGKEYVVADGDVMHFRLQHVNELVIPDALKARSGIQSRARCLPLDFRARPFGPPRNDGAIHMPR